MEGASMEGDAEIRAIKAIFDGADEDGSGELTIEEFCAKLGPLLGAGMSRQQVAQLFMKIDANAGGTVDWDEFSEYMLVERATALASESAGENWRLVPHGAGGGGGGQQPRAEGGPRSAEAVAEMRSGCHHETVDRIIYLPSQDGVGKYVTCGADGGFRVWGAPDLKHVKTVGHGGSWAVDCVHLPAAGRLVVCDMSGLLSFYDPARGSFDLSGRLYAPGGMGTPMCLARLVVRGAERLLYGDSQGAAVLVLASGDKELPGRELLHSGCCQDYVVLHDHLHKDWVTQVEHVPDVGLVSASADTTLKVWDMGREVLVTNVTLHTKSVACFVHSTAFSLFASGGAERDIALWSNHGCRIGALHGHSASVVRLAIDQRLNQVFSLGADHVVKVWDVRNNRCLQTIAKDDWVHALDECRPEAMMYDSRHRRLVTARYRPYVWAHKLVSQDRTGHHFPIHAAIFNDTFFTVVSIDEGGTVCSWDVQTGARVARFTRAHGEAKVTAAALDDNQRRLVTAASDGSVRMWNFNNGSLLCSFHHDQDPLEVTSVQLALATGVNAGGGEQLFAAGWNRCVFVFEDNGEKQVDTSRAFLGHQEDVLCMAAHRPRQLLATGDYGGAILLWDMGSGERLAALRHEASQYQASVECLTWMPVYSPQQCSAAAAAAHRCTSADAGHLSQTTCARLAAEVRQPVGDDESSSCSGRNRKLDSQPEAPQAVSGSQQSPWQAAAATGRPPAALLLLSGGGDGALRVWQVAGGAKVVPVGNLPWPSGSQRVVTAVCAATDAGHVAAGDCQGNVNVWDVSRGVDVGSGGAVCCSSFLQRCQWRAHSGGVSSIGAVPGWGLLVTAGRDCIVSVWTLDGGQVGTFGEHTWDLSDRATWRDPLATARPAAAELPSQPAAEPRPHRQEHADGATGPPASGAQVPAQPCGSADGVQAGDAFGGPRVGSAVGLGGAHTHGSPRLPATAGKPVSLLAQVLVQACKECRAEGSGLAPALESPHSLLHTRVLERVPSDVTELLPERRKRVPFKKATAGS